MASFLLPHLFSRCKIQLLHKQQRTRKLLLAPHSQ
jgi:hypothetical protein